MKKIINHKIISNCVFGENKPEIIETGYNGKTKQTIKTKA